MCSSARQRIRRAATYPTGFEERTIAGGLTGPVGTAWTPDGRMLVIEKEGHLKVVQPGSSSATTILDISGRVNSYWDRGLLGIAVDSSFASNRFIYLLYTYDLNPLTPDGGSVATSRLSRFELSPSNTLTNEVVLLGTYSGGPCPAPSNTVDCIPSEGRLTRSGASGLTPTAPCTWARETRPASPAWTRWRSAPTTSSRWRARCSISTATAAASRAILLPHQLQPHSRLREDLRQGAPGIRTGSSFGPAARSWWATSAGTRARSGLPDRREELRLAVLRGTIRTPGYRDRTECAAEYAKEGTSSAHVGPVHDYAHAGNSAVLAGPTYQGSEYPSGYPDTIFFGDYAAGFIKKLRIGANGSATAEAFATGWTGTDLDAAPNGDLVFADFGDGSPGTGAIKRVAYSPGNRSPVANATATPTSGSAPLAVQLSSTGSSDPDGDPLTYSWNFGDGTSSTAANPSHYTQNGTWTATLTVSDGRGLTATDSVEISVGGSGPTATIIAPLDESKYRDGDTVTLRGSATDPDEGNLPASALSWNVIVHHASHISPGRHLRRRRRGQFPGTPRPRRGLVVRDNAPRHRLHGPDRAADGQNPAGDGAVRHPERSVGCPRQLRRHGDHDTVPAQTRQSGSTRRSPSPRPTQRATTGRTCSTSWSDGGAASHDITVPATATF